MTPDINLKELERKAWASTFEDGFFDIAFGVALSTCAAASVIREAIGLWYILVITLIPALFSILLVYFGKRTITEPRAGMAKFGPDRSAALKKSVRLSSLTFIVLAVLVGLTVLNNTTGVVDVGVQGYTVPFVIAVGVAVILALKARLLGIPRLIPYGCAIGIGVLVAEVLHRTIGDPWDYLIAFGVPGVCIFIYGVHLLATFIRKFPLTTEEM